MAHSEVSTADVLEAAIDRVTRAMLTAPDEKIPGLVAERASMRQELRELRERERQAERDDDAPANLIRLDDRR